MEQVLIDRAALRVIEFMRQNGAPSAHWGWLESEAYLTLKTRNVLELDRLAFKILDRINLFYDSQGKEENEEK